MKTATRTDDRAMAYLGYKAYPNLATRPHCDMCGAFRGRYLRFLYTDDVGAVHRCHGCDNE